MIQTTIIENKFGVRRAINDGVTNMPAPMIQPTTKANACRKCISRLNAFWLILSAAGSGCIESMFSAIFVVVESVFIFSTFFKISKNQMDVVSVKKIE